MGTCCPSCGCWKFAGEKLSMLWHCGAVGQPRVLHFVAGDAGGSRRDPQRGTRDNRAARLDDVAVRAGHAAVTSGQRKRMIRGRFLFEAVGAVAVAALSPHFMRLSVTRSALAGRRPDLAVVTLEASGHEHGFDVVRRMDRAMDDAHVAVDAYHRCMTRVREPGGALRLRPPVRVAVETVAPGDLARDCERRQVLARDMYPQLVQAT